MFPLDFLCFAFAWPATLRSATIHVWPELKRPGSGIFALGAFPLPNGQGAGVVGARSMLFDDPAQSDQCWARFCSEDPLIRDVVQARRFPKDFARIRRPWGHAVRYGLEGVALLGDAIHPVSPVGAQGANMSIADACVLAELALRDDATLAQEYERRRRPANERSIRFTRRAALMLELPDWCFRWFPTSVLLSILPWVGRHQSLLHRAIRSAAGAFQER
jgi:2-polyprenyl-6-methoxyphenol hydroxylase-like FAD-dependent oxidoreductase